MLLASGSAVLADRSAAGELIDDAADVVPLAADGHPLSGRERQAASRLLQALHLFEIDPNAGEPERALGELPAWVLEGGKARKGSGGRGRSKKQVEELRGALAGLLTAARRDGLQGTGEGDLTELSEVVRGGLPPSHALVLAESAVAADHPLVRVLEERGAALAVGRLESERGSWQGVDLLAAELERQTGVAIASDAMAELARRAPCGRRATRAAAERAEWTATRRPASPASTASSPTSSKGGGTGGSTVSWWSRRWRTAARRTSGSSSTPSRRGAAARRSTACAGC